MKYYPLPSQQFGYKQLFEATELVDNAFATGYFKNHLDEIDCAWVATDNKKIVGWAAVAGCVLRCVVVHPDYRGQVIATKLTEKRLRYLGDCKEVLSYAWVRPDGRCMSCRNLENFGFELHQELDDYYYSIQNCKYCGSNCRCVAKQYIKINQR